MANVICHSKAALSSASPNAVVCVLEEGNMGRAGLMVSSSLMCSQFSILDSGLFSLHSACMVVLLRCVLDPCPQGGQSSRGTST